jgi:hypothetical protein
MAFAKGWKKKTNSSIEKDVATKEDGMLGTINTQILSTLRISF